MNKKLLPVISAVSLPALLFMIASCAQIGNPSGGPRDEDPPRFLGASPAQGTVNFNSKKAVLYFDELVNLKDSYSKVVMSPPGESAPRVSSLGNRVTIEFQDTLLPNTTYTVNFGDAIVDNNEGNKLENFMYTFSTGPELDTLMISGMVLGAEDLEPQAGMLVGLHTNLADSAFRTQRFERIAKTDEQGRFAIGGLAPGEYRVFALSDPDNDYKYSSPEEELAFYDVTVSPYTEEAMARDTIFNLKTGAVDSVVMRKRTRFLPNNILLRSFNSGFKQQYITTYERPDSTRISLIFNSPATSMPVLSIVDDSEEDSAARMIVERSQTNDTITLWLKDPRLLENDTLRLALSYLRGNSPSTMEEVSDTLRLITKKQKESKPEPKKKKGEEEEPEPEPAYKIKVLNSSLEPEKPLIVEVEAPLAELNAERWALEVKMDSVWEKIGTPELKPDSLNPRRYTVDIPWEYDTQYRLRADSLATTTIYGLHNETFSKEFKSKPEKEYSSLTVNVYNFGGENAYVNLLDGGGKVKATQVVAGGKVVFRHIVSGKYYLRLVIDRNGDQKYTPGDYDIGLQPDYVYYYPKAINIKQNWNQELGWDVFSKPVDRMKPYSLLKNKPKDGSRRVEEEE